MNMQNLEKRHLVVSHLENDRPFRIVGSANKKEEESHYTIFLRILPGIPFYIVPHRDRLGEYLVFSGKKKRADECPTFFCKVGSAIQLFDKNVIEIHLPDLRQVYYLKLDPGTQNESEGLKAA